MTLGLARWDEDGADGSVCFGQQFVDRQGSRILKQPAVGGVEKPQPLHGSVEDEDVGAHPVRDQSRV
jgi:hypothetical protein